MLRRTTHNFSGAVGSSTSHCSTTGDAAKNRSQLSGTSRVLHRAPTYCFATGDVARNRSQLSRGSRAAHLVHSVPTEDFVKNRSQPPRHRGGARGKRGEKRGRLGEGGGKGLKQALLAFFESLSVSTFVAAAIAATVAAIAETKTTLDGGDGQRSQVLGGSERFLGHTDGFRVCLLCYHGEARGLDMADEVKCQLVTGSGGSFDLAVDAVVVFRFGGKLRR